MISDTRFLGFLLIAILLMGAGEVRAQSCVASPPITPPSGTCYIFGTHDQCAPTPEAACDIKCGGKMEYPSDGPQSHLYFCYLKQTGPFAGKCGTFEANTDHTTGFSDLRTKYDPNGRCKAGDRLAVIPGGYGCWDKYALAENDANASAGLITIRDQQTGTITEIQQAGTFAPVVKFKDYDKFGRPWGYNPGTGWVTVTWPAGGACLFSAITVSDWTSTFAWGDLDHVSSIGGHVGHRPAHYDFGYYPDGDLMTAASYVALYGSTVLTARRYAEDGTQIAIKNTFLPPATTAAAVPGGTEAATPAPANPLLQPKVAVARVAPGGPLGARLLGPLGIVFPSQWIGEQIGRFYMNVHAAVVNNNTTKDKCDAQLFADNRACRKFWTDRGLDPYDLPTDDLKIMHNRCLRSALSNHEKCMDGVEPPLLELPFAGDVGNQANIDCLKNHARDKNSCRQAAQAKYAGSGGAFPTMFQVDLLGCIGSAQRRLAQCQAGQPLSDLLLP